MTNRHFIGFCEVLPLLSCQVKGTILIIIQVVENYPFKTLTSACVGVGIGSSQVTFTADELYGTALTSRGALSATNKITDAYFKTKQETITQNAATHLGLYYGLKPHLITVKNS